MKPLIWITVLGLLIGSVLICAWVPAFGIQISPVDPPTEPCNGGMWLNKTSGALWTCVGGEGQNLDEDTALAALLLADQ